MLCNAAPADRVFIVGDFNLAGLDWICNNDENLNDLTPLNATSDKEVAFVESISSLSMCQVNCTRNQLNRVLDLVLTDSPNDVEFCDCDALLKIDCHHPLTLALGFLPIVFHTIMSHHVYN